MGTAHGEVTSKYCTVSKPVLSPELVLRKYRDSSVWQSHIVFWHLSFFFLHRPSGPLHRASGFSILDAMRSLVISDRGVGRVRSGETEMAMIPTWLTASVRSTPYLYCTILSTSEAD